METIVEKKEGNHASVSEFESKSITRLFWKYSLFALAGMAMQGVAVIVDGFLVGNGIGPAGLAAIGIIVPFWTVSVAFFSLFGVGGSILAAIKLGNGDKEGARDVYGSIIMFSLYFSVVVAAIVLANMDSILTAMGATPEILPIARDYAVPFMIGNPICVVGSVAYYFTRVAERPFAASVAYVVPAIICMTVEYIIIFRLDGGIFGSSFSWVICVGLAILLIPYLQFTKSIFKLKVSDFKVKFDLVIGTCKIGFAMFIIQIATIVSTIIINNLIAKYGDPSLYISAFGVLNAYIAYILMIVTTAFVTGIQPIAGYNIGAKLYSRVRELIKIGVVQSTAVIVLVMVLVFAFSHQVTTFFVGNEPVLLNATIEVMKIFLLLYALGNVSQIVSGYFMAVEKNGLAILNGVARIIIFAVPLLFILPNFFGLNGVWMAQPGADLLSFILAVVCIINEYRKLKKMELTL